MKNITQFLLMLTLSFYIAFAPAFAYANYSQYPLEVQLEFARQDAAAKRIAGTATSFDSNGVAVPVTKQTPIQVTVKTAATATTAAATETATITATQTAVKKVMPTAGQVAKGFGRSVGVTMVAMALYDLLGKAVDYVLDSANNRAIVKDQKLNYEGLTVEQAGQKFCASHNTTFDYAVLLNNGVSYRLHCKSILIDGSPYYPYTVVDFPGSGDASYSYETLADKGLNLAKSGNTQAQSGVIDVVNDMSSNPTTYNIDNSYFDGGTVINDNSDEIINNYITNNYPNIANNLNKSDGTVTNSDGSVSTTTTKDNGDGTSTQTTVTNNTTNNTSSTTNTTYNNTTNNITNISYVTNITNINEQPATASTPAATASTPSSTTASTPASATGSTELPEFCDWAKPVCDFIDWFKKDPDLQDTDIPLDDTPLRNPTEFDKDYIKVTAQCPDDVERQIPVGNMSFTLRFPMSPLCDFLSTYARPVIILMAYITAALSIGNAFRVGG